MFATIITLVDGTPATEHVLEYAIHLRSMADSELMVMWVIPRPEQNDDSRSHGGPTPLVCNYRNGDIERDEVRAHVYLEGLRKRYDLDQSTITMTRVGDMGHQIKHVASSCHRPLLVLGTRHGRETAWDHTIAQQLVAEATIPVLAVPMLHS